jgi:hypothetical protein
MEDDSSALYRRAIRASISDGFARGFKEEIQTFKIVYHQRRGMQEQEAIQALNLMSGPS